VMQRLLDHPVAHLVAERRREFLREPGVLFWTFGFPILLVAVLSLAFRSKGPEETPIVVIAGADVAEADAIAARIDASDALRASVMDEAAARHALKEGRAAMLVRPSPGAAPTFVIDESRPESPLAAAATREALAAAGAVTYPLEKVTAKGQRYVDFLLPGMIGMTLLNGGAWGVGYSLILLRTRKLLKRLTATPMRRSHLLLAFLIFRLSMSLLEASLLTTLGMLFFDTPFDGSILAMLVLVAFSAFSFGGLGLLCGARAQNPQSGAGWVNVATLPMFLLSGVFFSAKNYPSWLQPAIDVLPLTAFNDGLRAIVNDGAGLATVAPHCAILAVWAIACFAVALRIFRWS
jgi:ABC-2 type transport system permease protein